jgi:hypothetical protein
MRINGYRCDGCGKEHLLEAYRIPSFHGEMLPDEWFLVHHGKYAPDKEPWLFCSKKCLRHHPLVSSESSAESILNHCSIPSLTIECEYEGRKYKGTAHAVEEPT